MTPLQSYIDRRAADSDGSKGSLRSQKEKVSQHQLLDTLIKIQSDARLFESALHKSLLGLSEKVANNFWEDDSSDVDIRDQTLPSSSPLSPVMVRGKENTTKMLKKNIEKTADKMFAMMDTNETNEISILDSFQFVARSGLKIAGQGVQTEESIAAVYDANGNGWIDRGEFRQIVMDM
jgi:hypothetical protein